jgi:fructokinase
MVQVACFGETLWDEFDQQRVLGGAPLNVAAHLTLLGVNTALISKIGQDALGEEVIQILKSKNVPLNYLQKDKYHPTGRVKVTLNTENDASYDFVFPSAWDFIDHSGPLRKMVANAPYFVYGSLSTRSEASRETLFKLLEVAQFRIFDVNLRAPHFSREMILKLIQKADILKINEVELERIGSWFGYSSEDHLQIVKELLQAFQLHSIIVTLGSKGALVAWSDQIIQQTAFKVRVEDTVGSGDAFLAAYISKMIQHQEPSACLNFACATGALVASRSGANPDYSLSEIEQLIASNIHNSIPKIKDEKISIFKPNIQL